MPLVETSHTVDIKIENGVATYTVRRMFKNPGDLAEQVELQLGLPYGAAATGLRIKANSTWYTGVLMEREAAAKLYEEMTGVGQFKPKDPALLAWMWADTLSLQIFPVMPNSTSTVEYTLTAPTRYEGGRYLEAALTGESVALDFNLAYNPYCAYADHWSCPIPPSENRLKVAIRAGEKTFGDQP